MVAMPNPHRRVVIVGASFAGLFAAAAIARAGAEVTLLERDRLSDHAEPRPGVPQGVQPHILLHRGLVSVEDLLPGLERNVLDRGGLRLDTGKIPWLSLHGWSPTNLPSYDILSVSRPVLELVVRRRVLELPGVSLRDGFRVSGLDEAADSWEVRSSTGESVFGDVVIDASGRGSRLSHWLTELGYPVPEPESIGAKLGYASRRYQGPEAPPLDAGLVIVATPESPLGSTILPIEDRQWLVLAAGYGERRPSRDPSQFVDFLSSLRDPAAADFVSYLQPLGDVAVYRQTENRRIPYARAANWPRGLLVTGDALSAFNPIYGQGITVAAMQAELLGKVIGQTNTTRSTRRLQRRLLAVTALPWSIATSEDLRQPTASGRQTAGHRLLNRWTDRIDRLAVAGDPACAAALTEVYHLVGAPRLLFSPRVVATVMRSYVRGLPPTLPRPAVLDRIHAPTDPEDAGG
jgi:2-polyprenyl-6-methoxyphenol hydroxylase-like FAD-dependent oxidoreductase